MLNAYVFYDGQCEAAFKYYEKELGGKIQALLRNQDAPPEVACAPDRKQMIMHGSMAIDGQVLMASDVPPEHFRKPQGFCVSLQVADVAEAERKFNALAKGGTVSMPFGKTFWAKGFGSCTDQFGIPWMVNCPAEGM